MNNLNRRKADSKDFGVIKSLINFIIICFVIALSVSILLSILLLYLNDCLSLKNFLITTIYFSIIYFFITASLGLLSCIVRYFHEKLFHINVSFLIFTTSFLLSFLIIFTLFSRFHIAYQFLSVRPFITIIGIIDLASLVVLFIAFQILFYNLLAHLLKKPAFHKYKAKKFNAILFFSILFITSTVFYLNYIDEKPPEYIDLDISLRKSLDNSSEKTVSEVIEKANPEDKPKIIIIGLDGLEWRILIPLLQAERMPNFKKILLNGAYGYLNNENLSLSPPIWTSISTGKKPEKHRILDSASVLLKGIDEPLNNFPSLSGNNSAFAIRRILHATEFSGFWEYSTYNRFHNKSSNLWEILSSLKIKCGVVNALGAWPAININGFIYSFKDFENAYPKDMPTYEFKTQQVPLQELKNTKGINSALKREQEAWNFAMELYCKYDIELCFYYTHGIDTICHLNWDFLFKDSFFYYRKKKYINKWDKLIQDTLIAQSYIHFDKLLGDVFDLDFTNIVILSDHGWTFKGYEHFNSPDGIIIFSGNNIKKNHVIKNATIYDIAPTILFMFNVPLAKDMDGQVLRDIFEETYAASRNIAYIKSYDHLLQNIEKIKIKIDKEEIKRLKNLGYIN